MLICRGNHTRHATTPICIENSTLDWVNKTRLLGMTVNDKLNWISHTLDLKKRLANKLDLLKRSRFLPRNTRKDLYFKVIIPSIIYGVCMWEGCNKSHIFSSLERMHFRAAKIIFILARDMPSAEMLEFVEWPAL